ncbi:hypothetical protein UFOVP1393_45 [uncultured Caudovirales phage]|uniref:Uncharacterized protein n=1 Tax=uncultured Caudovirales phage TaxID=2100421 RepID=A0A6J5S720_9CAUD|nr:hypothetical protein UFOVP1393_45 [uncultured Caudovirales phage]
MPCPLTQNYTLKDCLSTAGVASWYITPFSNMLTAVLTANVVTAITKTLAFKTIAQEIEQGTWSYTGAGTSAAGTKAYDWECSIKMNGLNTLDQQEIELILSNKVVLIAVMQNGDAWMLGRGYGSNAIDSKFEAGTAMGDFIGTTLTVKGRSSVSAVKVDPTILAGLLTA